MEIDGRVIFAILTFVSMLFVLNVMNGYQHKQAQYSKAEEDTIQALLKTEYNIDLSTVKLDSKYNVTKAKEIICGQEKSLEVLGGLLCMYMLLPCRKT